MRQPHGNAGYVAVLEAEVPGHERLRAVGPQVVERRAALAGISMTSANPAVVTSATRPPLRSRSALVATVVPWASLVTSAPAPGHALADRPARVVGSRQQLHDAPGVAPHVGQGAARVDPAAHRRATVPGYPWPS